MHSSVVEKLPVVDKTLPPDNFYLAKVPSSGQLPVVDKKIWDFYEFLLFAIFMTITLYSLISMTLCLIILGPKSSCYALIPRVTINYSLNRMANFWRIPLLQLIFLGKWSSCYAYYPCTEYHAPMHGCTHG